jgi:hypothetical protein
MAAGEKDLGRPIVHRNAVLARVDQELRQSIRRITEEASCWV